MKENFIFLADGFEDLEALSPIDILRRAGMPIKIVSVMDTPSVTSAHGVVVNADYLWREGIADNADWLILPGGMPGATNLYDFKPLTDLLKRHAATQSGRIAAICAAPGVVLGQLGLLADQKATCYPGFDKMMEGADYTAAPVQVSGRFVTANGPANAINWALTIVKETLGAMAAQEVANAMQMNTLDAKYIYS